MAATEDLTNVADMVVTTEATRQTERETETYSAFFGRQQRQPNRFTISEHESNAAAVTNITYL